MLHVPSRSYNFADFAPQTSFGGHVSPCASLPRARGCQPAIKTELGLPESLVGALPIVGAANLAMGMELECWMSPRRC